MTGFFYVKKFNNVMEIWKIIEHDNKYEISNTGKIRNSITGRELKTTFQTASENGKRIKGGYESIKIKTKHHLIHRLVAEAFLEKVEDKPLVDHIDRNKFNNHVSNLRWVNWSENFKNSERGDKFSVVGSKFTGINYREIDKQWIVHMRGQVLPTYHNSLEEAYATLRNQIVAE